MSRKNKKTHIISNIFIVIFSLIFLLCAFVLVDKLLLQPKKNADTLEEAQTIYESSSDDPVKSLQEINPDIVSFITVPNTVINYPVLMPTKDEGDSYYLTHNYKKQYSSYGSIFIDSSCPEGLNSKNVLLHGHNMNDGSMFAGILNYDDIDFYKENPLITFDNCSWEVFAVNKLNVDSSQGEIFNYLQCGFASDEDFLNYVNEVITRSLISTPVTINENDQIMLMSTCSYEYKNFRTAVYARKVRDYEDGSIDTSVAKYNNNPLMPQVYYTDHDAVEPTLTDFTTSLANSNATWYDGNKF